MNFIQLIKYWQDKSEQLYRYSIASIDKKNLTNDTIEFLTICGLPLSAAPFLSFEEIQEDKLMTPTQVFKIKFEGLENYLVFGYNGSGDTVCIDTKDNDAIVYLNHDNYFERVYINKSILQFALCLTKYKDFMTSIVDISSTGMERRKFNNSEYIQLKNELATIDNSCLNDKTFWKIELGCLLEERDNV